MVKTKIEKIDVGRSDVSVFSISGKLGFHENFKVKRLTEECLRRSFKRVIFDLSELTSLGGGVAKILRDFTLEFRGRGSEVAFVVKNDIVLQFLQDEQSSIDVYSSLQDALHCEEGEHDPGAEPVAVEDSPSEAPMRDAGPDGETQRRGSRDGGGGEEEACTEAAAGDSGVILMPYYKDAECAETAKGTSESSRVETKPSEAAEPADSEQIFSEIFDPRPSSSESQLKDESDSRGAGKSDEEKDRSAAVEQLNKYLKRRILELKTLFSISNDFNSIREKKKLLEIFLLTSIAQGGVESAAFFEKDGDEFKPVMSKGLETDELEKVSISDSCLECLAGESTVAPFDRLTILQEEKEALKGVGLEHISAFKRKDNIVGLVLLGKRIAGRGMKDEDFEFLKILINIAQGAYDNALMFEREHERTLGIVKTLISLIEENTIIKGTSEFVSRYVGLVAKNINYPEEQFKELIYGTVLRDMGMVKVSDLILRSPRELTKEEWEIIKKHPEDGAEMLHRMKFSDHVVDIVRNHHERFNGEGYPSGLRGKEIPLGSRVISVVESYAAMIHERPSRPALSEKEALDTLKENYGLRYDREVVAQFTKIMEKEIARSIQPGIHVK